MADEDNVVDLEQRREKKGGKKKANPAELYLEVFNRMDRLPGGLSRLPAFDERFYMVRADTGRALVRVVEEDEHGTVVELCDQETLERAIAAYVTMRVTHTAYAFTPRQIKECAAFWRLHTVEQEEPKPFLWPREKGMGYRRLPWELGVGPTPTWDRLLAKMSNAEAFRAWVGSLFVQDSDMQQYVWIHGEGNDGKGSINRFLARVFGASYFAGQPPAKGDKFWGYYALIGKRLVVFPDCDDAKFVRSSLFKSLTGGDPIAVEQKKGALFTYKSRAKFLAFSNVRPELSSAKADMRRVIYCEFDASAPLIVCDDFEGDLEREGGAFLSACLELYSKQYPRRGGITSDDDTALQVEAWASTFEEEFEDAFEYHFKYDSKLQSKSEPISVQQRIKAAFPGSKNQQTAFREWMKRKYKIDKKGIKENGKVTYWYLGISIRHFEHGNNHVNR